MAKTHKLSTKWDVNASGILQFEQAGFDAAERPVGSFKLAVDLSDHGYQALTTDAGREALAFGFFTALRNGTGACDTLADAQEVCERRLAAWNEGDWGSERAPSAIPFHAKSAIVLAILRVPEAAGSLDAAAIAAKLCQRAEETIKANALGDSFAQADDKVRGKVRKAVADDVTKKSAKIGAALAQIMAEQAAAAAARKAAAASKALADAPEGEVTEGF